MTRAAGTSCCRGRRGFTFIEILATLTFIAIVLPAVMNGISLSLSAAKYARHQAQAATLGHSKLSELVAEGQVQDANLSGDFGEDWPGYRWTAQAWDWDGPELRELDVTVWWRHEGKDRGITFSTLVYSGDSP